MKRAFTIAKLLTSPLFLTGCFKDKEADLASCLLKYEKNGTDVQNVMLCMSAQGYKFADRWTDDKGKIANMTCWNAVPIDKEIFPAKPMYAFANCYSKRSILDLIK